MSDFIIVEEDFRLKIGEKVPEPSEGECFLLYQVGAGISNSLIISNGVRYSSAAVRRGHYNKKVILSLQYVDLSQNYKVRIINSDFYFYVNIKIIYQLQDAQKYYFHGQIEENAIIQAIRDCIFAQNKKWDISQEMELQNKLEIQIEKKLKKYEGVKFQIKIDVTLDEAAKKIMESNLNTKFNIHMSNNSTDEQIAINKNKEKVVESELKLQHQKIEEMINMMTQFGILGPIVGEYIQGDLGGTEFYEYMIKSKTNEVNILQAAMNNQMITQREASEQLIDILKNKRFTQGGQLLPGIKENQKQNEEGEMINQNEENGDSGIESDAPADGDYL